MKRHYAVATQLCSVGVSVCPGITVVLTVPIEIVAYYLRFEDAVVRVFTSRRIMYSYIYDKNILLTKKLLRILYGRITIRLYKRLVLLKSAYYTFTCSMH